ncbi:hypothetical protein ESCNG_540001 [Neisseria gonorrhoeae]|nr:hypothetical protein ESCNG_540001 [Neisseria gonorrhoeae]
MCRPPGAENAGKFTAAKRHGAQKRASGAAL